MTSAVPFAEVWRGPILESQHYGHAVICDGTGQIVQAWGDPEYIALPRSSAKMIQALPLVASGAAATHLLSAKRLALSCASHQGAKTHIDEVSAWLDEIGFSDHDLKCGPQETRDLDLRDEMIRNGIATCRMHNNCSGKHTGFLTLRKHIGGGPDYVALDHPVQLECKDVFETVTGEVSPGHGIDGCSAPNFATSMQGMARAMAWFATASKRGDALSRAARQLVEAMIAYPEMVAGEGRACTLLMRAAKEPFAIKTGAEGYFVAILPTRGLGVSVKIADGATRGAECAMAAILVRLGVLEENHPNVARFLSPPILNWDGLVTGQIKPASGLSA